LEQYLFLFPTNFFLVPKPNSEEAKESIGEKEQEVEGQRRRGGGALKFGLGAQG
jgi:hypothetical protein